MYLHARLYSDTRIQILRETPLMASVIFLVWRCPDVIVCSSGMNKTAYLELLQKEGFE